MKVSFLLPPDSKIWGMFLSCLLYDFLSDCCLPSNFIVPRFSRKQGTLKLIRLSVCPSGRPSVYHKNINLAHIFCSINDWALIFGMRDSCVKPF